MSKSDLPNSVNLSKVYFMVEFRKVTYIFFLVPIKECIIPWHAGMLFTYKFKTILVEIKMRGIANFSRL